MANELAKLNKTEAIELATRARNRANRFRANAEKMSERIVNTAIGTLAGFGTGYWQGQNEVEYQKNVAKYMAENPGKTLKDAQAEAEDPRKIGGALDKDLAVGLVLGGLAISGVTGRRITPFFEAGAIGALAGWAHGFGMDKAIEAAAEEEEQP